MQFWPPDDEHKCSKHVEAWNKIIVKQKFCASSWLITEIDILIYTVSKTPKFLIQRSISPQNSWLLRHNALKKFCHSNILWLLWYYSFLSKSGEDAARQCYKHCCQYCGPLQNTVYISQSQFVQNGDVKILGLCFSKWKVRQAMLPEPHCSVCADGGGRLSKAEAL